MKPTWIFACTLLLAGWNGYSMELKVEGADGGTRGRYGVCLDPGKTKDLIITAVGNEEVSPPAKGCEKLLPVPGAKVPMVIKGKWVAMENRRYIFESLPGVQRTLGAQPISPASQDEQLGPVVTWKILPSTPPGEYSIKLKGIVQKFYCPVNGSQSPRERSLSATVHVMVLKIHVWDFHQGEGSASVRMDLLPETSPGTLTLTAITDQGKEVVIYRKAQKGGANLLVDIDPAKLTQKTVPLNIREIHPTWTISGVTYRGNSFAVK